MRRCLLSLVTSFVAASPAAAGPGAAAIGIITPLSGPRASIGEDARAGASLALEDLKSGAGEERCPLTLQFEDSKGEPASGIAAFQKLAASGAKIIITQNSNISLPVAPLANSMGIVQLAISTTSDRYATPNDFTFRTNGGTIYEARALATYLAKEASAANACVALLTMEDEYPQSLRESLLREPALQRVEVCADERFAPKETDFRGITTRILSRRAKVAACLGYPAECGTLLKQIRRTEKEHFSFVGVTPVNNREFFEAAGSASEGAAVTYIKVDLTHPAAAEFKARYGHAPNVFSSNAYDAVTLLHQALRECKCRVEPACVKQALSRTRNFHGLSGTKSFDGIMGDMQDEYEVLTARGGAFVPTRE